MESVQTILRERISERVIERIVIMPVPRVLDDLTEVPEEYRGEDESNTEKIMIENGLENHRPLMLNTTGEVTLEGKFEAGDEEQPTERDDEANKAKIGRKSP